MSTEQHSIDEPVAPPPLDEGALLRALASWLPEQRWFSAKGHTVTGVHLLTRETLATTSELVVEHVLVRVDLEGAEAQIFQVPLGVRASVDEDLDPWVVTRDGGAVVFDALRDPDAISVYSDLLATGGTGEVRFLAMPGSDLQTGLRGKVLGAEQSNTSVILGDHHLLKIFRRVTIGINPDVELHRALGQAGCENVAPLRGWMEADIDHTETTLAMAQDFVAGSTEGWTTAQASVRDVLASGDVTTSDFTSEARELGRAVASVHADLASVLGTSLAPAAGTAADISARVETALPVIADLEQYLPRIRALIDQAAGTGGIDTQRIHGDLHLGQVLRTSERWVLIDFEGEPSKTFEERRTPDSTLRDVAGMIRSFDYAAMSHVVEIEEPQERARLEPVAREWVERNVSAFCDGYTEVAGHDPRISWALLRAYELDKAVYEAVYEARNRPTWLSIPLHAIERLVAE
ncbi:phosphotransferase [Rhodococcus sp. BP-349]|uniref:maltokinase N-terminal cap-like domain-containing protein n=1 Tax=unclassified Rhodococcus (in: high G+C Gram-positive bacteria) TaxID=192944 RepID=UPI001C9B6D66|nr:MULTISPECIES: phosphotransferase [unclassified Rhodococcus (in: high G+C Gram-positive bacteria)]MBY6539376.1 phosphotransferase [Rhodococcus sp. BP-363]MBY6544296.1 phosphotransferase [Rhodococcus sp. BP-369]MBY6563526.1 phosphotransferase [Rhodococcus sp. BP-370]MBY6577818.1 phosphotransferase [Rhodococcus sp. BP-364]MBY6587119.1 phosphotransferase [Rhodococcus sp. BP-358]